MELGRRAGFRNFRNFGQKKEFEELGFGPQSRRFPTFSALCRLIEKNKDFEGFYWS